MSQTPKMVRTPGCVSGSWRLDGTRMPAHVLYALSAQGFTTAAILEYYPHLSVAQVEFAVAWYRRAYHHREAAT